MPTSEVSGPQLTVPVGPRDHALGDEHAAVTLVEYGDFECPQCTRAFPIVQQVRVAFGERLRFVYRNFPLTNVHPHAQRAAEAAEWAAGQNAFWQMHDGLYTNGGRLAESDILALAERLGLSSGSLRQAWTAHTFIARIKEDFHSGLRSGVAGTPTFFINGVRHEHGWDREALSQAIERAAAERAPGG